MIALHCDHELCDIWAPIGPLTDDWIQILAGEDLIATYCSGYHAVIGLASIFTEPNHEVDYD